MKFPKNTWNQLKNLTVEQIISALEKDGWEKCKSPTARIPYRKVFADTGDVKRVEIHFHPKKTYGPKLLMGLLNDIWVVRKRHATSETCKEALQEVLKSYYKTRFLCNFDMKGVVTFRYNSLIFT